MILAPPHDIRIDMSLHKWKTDVTFIFMRITVVSLEQLLSSAKLIHDPVPRCSCHKNHRISDDSTKDLRRGAKLPNSCTDNLTM